MALDFSNDRMIRAFDENRSLVAEAVEVPQQGFTIMYYGEDGKASIGHEKIDEGRARKIVGRHNRL